MEFRHLKTGLGVGRNAEVDTVSHRDLCFSVCYSPAPYIKPVNIEYTKVFCLVSAVWLQIS